MATRDSFVKRYAVLIYFVLAVVLSWGIIVLTVGAGNLPVPAALADELGPMLYVGMLVGPSAAGLLMLGLTEGRAGLRDLLSRLGRWRVGVRWWLVALLAAPVSALVVLLVLSLFSPDFAPAIFTAENPGSMLLTALLTGVMVALFEEIGWTGFAIPQMRTRYGVLATGLIVGAVWGAWHFLPFWEADTFRAGLPFALLIGRLFTWLVAFRVLMVWLYDRTGSLLLAMVMHAMLVATTQVLPSLALSGVPLLVWLGAWALALWGLAAAALTVERGRADAPEARRRLA